MKIFCDKPNITKCSLLKNSIDIEKIDVNIELHFKKDKIYIINKELLKMPSLIRLLTNGENNSKN